MGVSLNATCDIVVRIGNLNTNVMDIQLKGIYVSEKMSEETTAFKSNLYINNVKAGTADNDGHGGSTFYQADDQRGRQLIKEAEDWCKKMPPITMDYYSNDGQVVTVPMTLEHYIDNLVSEHLKQKDAIRFQKMVQKHMPNSILYGTPGGDLFSMGFKVPISALLQSERGINGLKKAIQQKVLPALKEGHIILNTNIPSEIVQALGIGAAQIVEQKGVVTPKQSRQPDQQDERKSGKKPNHWSGVMS